MEIEKINELMTSQEASSQEINRIYASIKKDPAIRKTEKYIAERRKVLSEIFSKASANHALLEDQEILASHKYLTLKFFDTMKKSYTEAMEYLEKCEAKRQVVSQIYEPRFGESQEEELVSSPKMFIQIYRVNQIQRKLEMATQAMSDDKPEWYLDALVATLQKQWREIEDTHLMMLMESSTLDHTYFQDNMFEKVQTEFEVVIEQLLTRIEAKKPNNNHRINLPKIVIPVFTGSYESWGAFYDLYVKIIHENVQLTATEKMQYLKTNVKGEAAKLIKHLTVCDANYETAWNLLTKRYKNERITVTKHVDNILRLPKIVKGNAAELKYLHDTINENLEALKSLGIDVSTWDPMLTRIVSTIWDTETDEKYEQQVAEPNSVQKFSKMMQFLEKRVKCLESVNTGRGENTPYKGHDRWGAYKQPGEKSCWFCRNRGHTVHRCAKFKAIAQERLRATFDKERCRGYLSRDSSAQCLTTSACVHRGSRNKDANLHSSPSLRGGQAREGNNGWLFSGICRNNVTGEMQNLSTTVRTEEKAQANGAEFYVCKKKRCPEKRAELPSKKKWNPLVSVKPRRERKEEMSEQRKEIKRWRKLEVCPKVMTGLQRGKKEQLLPQKSRRIFAEEIKTKEAMRSESIRQRRSQPTFTGYQRAGKNMQLRPNCIVGRPSFQHLGQRASTTLVAQEKATRSEDIRNWFHRARRKKNRV